VTLLALALGLLYLWERPVRTDLAAFSLTIQVNEAPAGTRFEAWAGPWASWQGRAWNGAGAFAAGPLQAGQACALPVLRVPIGTRRWQGGYVPRRTWDLVMVRITGGDGQIRYLAVPLSADIRLGGLRPKYRLMTSIITLWQNLKVDGRAPDRIP
jgi:hypothetical protein